MAFAISHLKLEQQQPKYAALIDWSNPITRGLSVAWSAATPEVNLVNTKFSSESTAGISQQVNKYGITKAFAGNNSGKYQFITASETSAVTFFWIGNQQPQGTYPARPYSNSFGAGNGRFDVYLENTGTNPPIFQAFRSTTAGSWRPTNVGNWLDTKNHAFCVSYDGSSVSNVPNFYADGIKVSAVTTITTPSGSLVTAGNQTAIGGRPDTTTRQLVGGMTLFLRFDRVLTSSEIRSLVNNPWQIFFSSHKNIIVPPVAGGGTPTNQVTEADQAQSILASKLVNINQTLVTDTNFQINPVRIYSLTKQAETDTAQVIVVGKVSSVNQIIETDTADTINVATDGGLNICVELDYSQLISVYKTQSIQQVLETDSVTSIVAEKIVTVAQVAELDSVYSVQGLKYISLGLAVEPNSALVISVPTTLTLTASDISAIVEAIFSDPRLLTLGKFIALKDD